MFSVEIHSCGVIFHKIEAEDCVVGVAHEDLAEIVKAMGWGNKRVSTWG
jgi:hypothetical protein